MFVFLTSLIHPDASEDYQLKVELLKKTLTSLSHQKNKNFKVIVAVNEISNLEEFPKFVDFILLDTPVPESYKNTKKITYEDIRSDKGIKLSAALLASKKYNPHYVMVIDADDFVHINLVETILNSQDEVDLFFVEKGYEISLKEIAYRNLDNFHEKCGSCFIFKSDLLRLNDREIKEYELINTQKVKEQFNNFFITKLMGSHKFSKNFFEKYHKKIQSIPYRAVMYNVNTGVNHSNNVLASNHFKINDLILNDFGLKEIFL